MQIRLFGPFRLSLEGADLESLTRRQMALLALLALHPNQSLSKEWVIEQLWPGEGRTIGLLNKLILETQEALAPHPVILSPSHGIVRLDTADIEIDTLAFDTAQERKETDAAGLAKALDLYTGPLLEDWQNWYDGAWANRARDRYARRYREALAWLAEQAINSRDFEQGLRYLKALRADNDPAESLHGRMMDLLTNAEQFVLASQLYEEYRDYLRQARHVQPSRAMTERYEQIPRPSPHFQPAYEPALVEEEPIGGGMRMDSPYYIVRPSDEVVHAAVRRRDGIVRIEGPRQTGKTSLLARALEQGRQEGALVVITDFQALGPEDTASLDRFFLALAQQFHLSAKTSVTPADFWDARLSANMNFEGYLRDIILEETKIAVLWGIDEADRIFDRDYHSSVFGLFRSWLNKRALDPDSPWKRFTLILTYSAEARMLIPNPNESPFNVGTGTILQDFTREQLIDLNARYASPLKTETELTGLIRLAGGHPYLVRRILYELKTRALALRTSNQTSPFPYEGKAANIAPSPYEGEGRGGVKSDALSGIIEDCQKESSLFAEHLDRVYRTVMHSPERVRLVSDLLQGIPCEDRDTFSRLRSAGVLAGDSVAEARLRCGLYEDYLHKHLL